MSVRKGQARLRSIAKVISSESQLSEEDSTFLVTAFRTIADGGDADTALGVKAKKGERKRPYARDTKLKMQYVTGLIAAAIAPESEGGLGLTLQDAVALVDREWSGLPSKSTILRYWNDVRKTQEIEFTIKTD